MEKIYKIKHISIKKLFLNYNFEWSLEDQIQGLIAVNSSGKSTIRKKNKQN